MALESEIVRLVLYATQQLGMTLAVGAQTIVLVAYLIAMRDRVVEAKEAQFARAVRTVLFSGLGLIVLSGLGISALHFLGGELAVLLAPAFLFKWILVIGVLLFGLGVGRGLLTEWIGEGLAGGTWYALFFLHILAPVISWETLLILYAGWLGAFFLIWAALVFGTRERVASLATIVKKVVPLPKNTPFPPPKPTEVSKPLPPPPPPKPSEPLKPPSPPLAVPNIPSVNATFSTASSTIIPTPVPPPPAPIVKIENPLALRVPEQKITDPDAHPGLPAIRVMPKTPEDVDKQHRASVVKFE